MMKSNDAAELTAFNWIACDLMQKRARWSGVPATTWLSASEEQRREAQSEALDSFRTATSDPTLTLEQAQRLAERLVQASTIEQWIERERAARLRRAAHAQLSA